MITERIVGAALWAYPRELRKSRGGEIAGTVIDVSEGSSWRLLGESLWLVRSGFSARASVASSAGGRRLVASACAQGVTVWGLVMLLSYFALDRAFLSNTMEGSQSTFFLTQALIAASVALALVGYDRIAALFGFAWIVPYAQQDLSAWNVGISGGPARLIATMFVPVACYVVMLLMPRSRSRDVRRLLWLAAAALVIVAPWLPVLGFGMSLGGTVLLVLMLVGLFLLLTGSSLPLGVAIALFTYGIALWTSRNGNNFSEALFVLRWVMTTAGPLLLAGGTALRFSSIRRRLAG